MNSLLAIIFVVMTLMGAFAAYFLKIASSSKTAGEIIKNKFFYFGGVLYFLSALINIYLLKYIEFSIVLPLTSVTYIWTMIIAYKYLNEKITKKKIIGTSLVMIGVFILVLN